MHSFFDQLVHQYEDFRLRQPVFQCYCFMRRQKIQGYLLGSSSEGDEVLLNTRGFLFVHSFICPLVCPPPQVLSALKSSLSDLESTLLGLKSALSGQGHTISRR